MTKLHENLRLWFDSVKTNLMNNKEDKTLINKRTRFTAKTKLSIKELNEVINLLDVLLANAREKDCIVEQKYCFNGGSLKKIIDYEPFIASQTIEYKNEILIIELSFTYRYFCEIPTGETSIEFDLTKRQYNQMLETWDFKKTIQELYAQVKENK